MTPRAYCKFHRISGAAFARRVGISETFGWRILRKNRKVSREMAIQIETATAGEITRHDLRPDLFGRWPKAARPANATLSMTSQPEQTAPAADAGDGAR